MAQGETSIRNAMAYQARQMRWVVEGKAIDYNTIPLR